MSRPTVGSLRELSSRQEVLNCLKEISAELGGLSVVEDVNLYPDDESEPYVIIRYDGLLYKNSVRNFVQKTGNKYVFSSCLTPLDLINHRLNLVHDGKISYVDERGPNVKVDDKVTFNCPVHGNFSSRLSSVLDSRGCAKCSSKLRGLALRKDLSYFVDKFRKIHGDRFEYSDLRIIDDKPRVLVECKIHGKFIQDTSTHMSGLGCPQCSYQKHSDDNIGWGLTDWIRASNKSKHFDSFKMYVIKCTDIKTNETFYKVGRTFYTVKKRFYSVSNMPYEYEILDVVGSTNPEFIFKLENEIKRNMKEYKYIPEKEFNGRKECFNKRPILDEYIHKH